MAPRSQGLAAAAWTMAWVALSAPAGTPAGPATAPTPQDNVKYARSVFQGLYGKDLRAVAATPGTDDDVALAEKILRGAPNAAPQPALLATMCRAAYDLGTKALGGYGPAIRAMTLLAKHQPAREKDCWEKIHVLLIRKFSRTKKFDRLVAGEHLLARRVDRAERRIAAGDYDEALVLLRGALATARAIRWPRAAELRAMQKHVGERARFARQARPLAAAVKARPTDAASRRKLIGLYAIELDDPVRAATWVDASVDAVTATCVPLAAKGFDGLDPNAAVEMGRWYAAEAGRASPGARAALWTRAAGYFRYVIRSSPIAHVNRLRAKVALQSATEALASAAGRYPLKKLTGRGPLDLLARGRARNRMPIKIQIDLLARDLSADHGGAKIRATFRPDEADKQIVTASIDSRALRHLDALAVLPLTALSLEDCSALKSLRGLEDMPLRSLNLSGCVGLEDVSALEGMGLRSLSVCACPGLGDLELLGRLPLRSLKLTGFTAIRDLAPLAGGEITSLSLTGCGIETLRGVEALALTRLSVSECPRVRSVEALAPLETVTSLKLADCARLTSLDGVEGLPLMSLSLSGCRALTGDLGALKDSRLTTLNLADCRKLTSLRGIEGKLLESLDCSGCRGLTGDLAPLKAMPLTRLNLEDCNSLDSLAGIEALPLASLVVAGCSGVGEDLSAIGALKLTSLDVSRCRRLRSLAGLPIATLRTLTASDCPALEDLAALAQCRLRELNLSGCRKLTEEALAPLLANTSLVRFTPPKRGMGRAIAQAIEDRRVKAKAARDRRQR